jgi:BirA family transcriptional regulator, biotin operon repressor / biotin---[acetyl-CoA-carboxylase] ligase
VTEPPRRLHVWEGHPADAWRRRWRLPRLRVYRTIGSTNTLALRLAARGAAPGTTIIAEHQSAGRGQRGSAWHAPAGQALLFSVVAPTGARGRGPAGPAPIRAGLIVAGAIEALAGVTPRLKWPNDVLAPDGRKIAGILCEGAVGADGFLVIGIGINVLQEDTAFPAALRETATSILAAGGRPVQRAALAGSILRTLLDADDVAAPLTPRELDAIRGRDALLDVPLAINGLPAGAGAGIAADGALLVREDGRPVRPVYSGSVRPAAAGAGMDGHPTTNSFQAITTDG